MPRSGEEGFVQFEGLLVPLMGVVVLVFVRFLFVACRRIGGVVMILFLIYCLKNWMRFLALERNVY